MEHIVQFAIGIDDDAIRERIVANAEKEIIKDLKQDVANKLFEAYYYNGNANPKKDPLSDYAKGIVEKFLEQHQEEILNKAAVHLADKLARTKKGKEILNNLE
jgi:hypothetical protein